MEKRNLKLNVAEKNESTRMNNDLLDILSNNNEGISNQKLIDYLNGNFWIKKNMKWKNG